MGILKNKKDKWKIKKDEKDFVISEEVAGRQVKSFLEFYKIDVADWENGESILEKLVDFTRMKLVRFEVKDGKMKIYQTLHRYIDKPDPSQEIVYGEIGGIHKKATDGYQETERYSAMYSMMGSMSGLGEDAISGLQGFDISLVECIAALFLKV